MNIEALRVWSGKGTMAVASLLVLAGEFEARGQDASQPAPPPPPPKWDLSVAFGLTLTEGNSDSVLFTLLGRGAKKWEENELLLGADLTYGETEDVKNSDLARAFAQYNRLITDRWFWYLRGEALHDDIADVDYRFTVGPGTGYYLIKEARTFLSVEGGPSFVYEKQGGDTKGYFTVRLAEKFEHKFNDRARVWQSLEFLPQVDRVENFIVNAEVGVESALTKSWSVSVILQDTYDNEPAPGRQENDLKLISAVTWKY